MKTIINAVYNIYHGIDQKSPQYYSVHSEIN